MQLLRRCYRIHLLCLLFAVQQLQAQEIELYRDPWGIPHIFSETDEGAFFGLGYATAQDRALQMTYSLRLIQGRLSEVVGLAPRLNRSETSVDHDRKMRTFGFYRHAQRLALQLDPASRQLLQAYCDGVNAYFRENSNELHPLFTKLELKHETWTPADCIASWWHLGQFFATDGTRDLMAGRAPQLSTRGDSRDRIRPGAITQKARPRGTIDESAAVVKKSDLTAQWIQQVSNFAAEQGMEEKKVEPVAEPPKFSHAWVVGGQRSTTGSAVLVSDPQTPVRNPSLFYEYHLQGKTFNARGIGVPGSPMILIGFTDRVAWGVTALGADQADLFQLETQADRPDEYRFDDRWLPMTVWQETIHVKGGPSQSITLRETHLGPVATAYCYVQPGEPEVALKRIPVCETDRETIQAALAMMRATDVSELDAALSAWRFPSANMIFGDRQGNIGYRVVGAIPVRSRLDPSHGRTAQPGHRSDQDWQGVVPHHLLPGVINPQQGYLFSANHRPIESWYPIPMGITTGSLGDTLRSWRLRERLQQQQKFSPEQVLEIHFDDVNPARRDMVRLAIHLRAVLGQRLSEEADLALDLLVPWYAAGASTSLDQPGAALALELSTQFRLIHTDLTSIYGGGESGLAYFLKTATSRIDNDPLEALDELEHEFIDNSLSQAWRAASQSYGTEPQQWNARARAAIQLQSLGYYESLDGFPALDGQSAVAIPALVRLDGGTIGCQTSQSYTQWVNLADPDSSQSLLPIGQSERLDSPARLSTLKLWSTSGLHPAPLSRSRVEALGVTQHSLPAR